MGLFAQHNHAGMIRLYHMALESALSDLQIKIGNKLVTLPILSTSGERRTYTTQDEQNTLNTFPRSTIKFIDMQTDNDRQLNKNLVQFCPGSGIKTRPPVPKIFTYQYTAVTKKRNEAEQIVEQIMYAFSPYLVFKLKERPSHNEHMDVRVNVEFRPIEDNHNDSPDPVSYTVDLLFTVHGNLYGPDTTQTGVIEKIEIMTNETGDMNQDPLTLWFEVVKEVTP